MSLFGDINLIELFNNESDYAKEYRFDALTEDMISRAEKTIGYKLPKSYIELLKVQNGGLIDAKYDKIFMTAIYGIGPTKESYNGLENMFENWKDEWQYPDIGIPFGETPSGGHDMFYMDYRSVDENGEPRIVRIDNECDNAIYFVADNLVEFVKMVYNNQEIEESLISQEEGEKSTEPAKGCYIATCVYGSYDCPQVWTLRRFRDYTLDGTWYGRVFIKCYYAISPILVKWFGDTKWFRSFWKSRLDKMVSNLNNKGVNNTHYNDRY